MAGIIATAFHNCLTRRRHHHPISDLEKQRTQTSLKLADEKALLLQMQKLKQQKLKVAEYQERNAHIQTLKVRLTSWIKQR